MKSILEIKVGQRGQHWMVSAILVAMTGFFFVAAATPESRRCKEEEAIKAETDSSGLKSWTQLYNSYRRYAQCDDGAISEGYSDVVAHLLTEHWTKVGELAKLSKHDKNFERFVLRHIDELMSPDQARAIHDNTQLHCPNNALRLCKAIRQRIIALAPPVRDQLQ